MVDDCPIVRIQNWSDFALQTPLHMLSLLAEPFCVGAHSPANTPCEDVKHAVRLLRQNGSCCQLPFMFCFRLLS